MFQNAFFRPAFGLPLAGLIVFGLYSFMQSMIAVDYVPPEPVPERDLTAFIAKPTSKDDPAPSTRPELLPIAERPTPPPKFAAAPGTINIPVVPFSGAVPATIDTNILSGLDVEPAVIGNRDIQPISPPIVDYPRSLAQRGVEGECEVRFDVDTRGRPYNVSAICSHSGFEREATRAVSRVQFAPMVRRGQAVERQNVVYPIEFRL
ncbi:TonB family protein [Henriciella sp. AS95]|uniref:energy transducer TonB n=1 Tax=Henriciella sp. AS95 TaxID=3135782 RepID=UPI00317B8E32